MNAIMRSVITAGLLACSSLAFEARLDAQSYVFCSNGSYFTAYGPSQWWVTVSGQGFCAVYSSLGTASLRWTYNITNYPQINYAKWDWSGTAYELPYNGHYFAFIDSSVSSRTQNARYLLTYNTASSYEVFLNQALVSESWTRLTSGSGLYKPRNAWLDDPTGECNSCRKVVFDEIKIEY
jgi:hypothetical protein